MTLNETTLVRELIEEHEPIEDLRLNYRLVAEGIDPHDAIVIQGILEDQDRIRYDCETRCFSTL